MQVATPEGAASLVLPAPPAPAAGGPAVAPVLAPPPAPAPTMPPAEVAPPPAAAGSPCAAPSPPPKPKAPAPATDAIAEAEQEVADLQANKAKKQVAEMERKAKEEAGDKMYMAEQLAMQDVDKTLDNSLLASELEATSDSENLIGSVKAEDEKKLSRMDQAVKEMAEAWHAKMKAQVLEVARDLTVKRIRQRTEEVNQSRDEMLAFHRLLEPDVRETIRVATDSNSTVYHMDVKSRKAAKVWPAMWNHTNTHVKIAMNESNFSVVMVHNASIEAQAVLDETVRAKTETLKSQDEAVQSELVSEKISKETKERGKAIDKLLLSVAGAMEKGSNAAQEAKAAEFMAEKTLSKIEEGVALVATSNRQPLRASPHLRPARTAA